jgi:uncharacterized membrane protein YcaP (DUF421 family)
VYVDWLLDADWRGMLRPEAGLLEIFIRGTVVYIALFLLLRLVLRRQSSDLGVTDLLVVVLIADAAQNAMADDYASLPDGVLLVTVIVFWAWALDWLGFRFPFVERLLKPPKLPLVEDGRLRRDNMRSELLTIEELRSQLRQQGIDDLAEVHRAYMEPDGKVSVLRREAEHDDERGKAVI